MVSYYVDLPKLNANAMADFAPVNRAIKGLGETFTADRQRSDRQEIGNAMAESRYGDASKAAFRQGNLDTGLGIKKHESELASSGRKEEEAYAQRVGQYFQNFIEPERDPAKRSGLVKAWIGSHPQIGPKLTESGLDPNDTEGVIRFVKSEATPFMTPKEQAELQRTQASTAAEQAREQSYLAQAEQRRGPKTVLDSLHDVPSKTEWESPRVQSLIQAAWGQPVPWEQRGQFLQAAGGGGTFGAGGDAFMPTTEEAELGITRQMKIESARHGKLTDMFGAPSKGKKYEIGANGEPVQRDLVSKQDQERKDKMLGQAEKVLDESEQKLLSQSYLERSVKGVLNMGDTARAISDYKMSALNIVYALSGKQTAVAEMRMFLEAYGPAAGDSDATLKHKAKRTREMIQTLAGGSPDEGDDPVAKEDPNKRRLYDKYGLE